MDINRLEYFFAAAEMGNFTQAADRCNIAQTTMSKYIVNLEDETGMTLFYRTNRGCHLTEQGQMFYDRMRILESEYNQIIRDIKADSEHELRIGIDGDFFRISVLQAFENSHKNVRLVLSFAVLDDLLASLRKRKIHAMIMPDVILHGLRDDYEFCTQDLFSEEGLLTYSSVSQERFETVADMITSIPLITKSDDRAYHDFCNDALYDAYGARFNDVKVVDSNSRQQLLVSLSQGFAIVPESEIAAGMDLRQRPISDAFKERLQLVYLPDNIPEQLLELLRFIGAK